MLLELGTQVTGREAIATPTGLISRKLAYPDPKALFRWIDRPGKEPKCVERVAICVEVALKSPKWLELRAKSVPL